ncbi:MAG: toxin [Gemmatimonadetes bacterium]|nr:toxin [Gemmatimonadota bacterium]
MSFERVTSAIQRGGLVDVLEHPNQERYPGQRIYVVEIDRYLHLVPFVVADDGTRFLKAIIPSRKAMRDYYRRQSR